MCSSQATNIWVIYFLLICNQLSVFSWPQLIDTLNKQYDTEKAELRKLSTFFAKIDRDKANEDEENAEAEAERERLRMAMRKVDLACAKIQALVRGVQARVAATKKGKKGKKKGKKK